MLGQTEANLCPTPGIKTKRYSHNWVFKRFNLSLHPGVRNWLALLSLELFFVMLLKAVVVEQLLCPAGGWDK